MIRSKVYGDPNVASANRRVLRKRNPIRVGSCYVEGKRCAESLSSIISHNLGIYVVRNFNTFGPRMHLNGGRVVTNFIMQAPGVRLKRNSQARS
jgi:UDP-glucuronate decarboxylase